MSRACVFLSLCVVCCGAAFAQAQSKTQEVQSPAQEIRAPAKQVGSNNSLPAFHRLFLPESEIERRAWKHRYLPVDAAEFERDLKAVDDYRRGAPSSGAPRLEQSTYIAQLIGDDLLVGTAQLTLAGSVKEPLLLPLGPCSLAIEAAHWPQANKPATIAIDASEKLQLLVEGERLDVRWSQRGQRTASGVVQFVLELPPCLVGTLELTVPAGAEIVAEGGIVTRPADPSPETATPPSTARWLIELQGLKSLSVRVVPKDAAGQRRPLTLLRHATTYEFSTRGINVATQLRLDVHGEPLERLKVDLDPKLHLISAKIGDMQIPWSSATDVETGETHIILEFHAPLSGTGRVIQLASVTPLVTGETIPLPRVLARQLAWQEGTATLLVPSALVLERLKTAGCRQSRVTTLPSPLTGESIEIQFYELEGRIDTRVAEPKQKLTLRSGHLVEITPDSLTTSSVFDLGSGLGATKTLELPLRSGWIVDAVQNAKGAEPLAWDVEEHALDGAAVGHGAVGEGAASGVLRIQPGAASRVIVKAHTPRGDERLLPAAAARAFDLNSFESASELLSVQGAGGLEVQWQSENLPGRDPKTLTAEELLLFAQPPSQMVVRADERINEASLAIERERPEFTAELRVDVVVQGASLTETFTVLCTPAASRVDRMLVHLSQRRDEAVRWSLAGGNSAGEFSARRLSEAEQTTFGLAGGEVWELLLKLPRLGTFEVRGQRKAPFTSASPVALASVPGANNQRGTLAIRALGETGLAIQNRGLTSVPAEVLDDQHYQTARAAYHYAPSADDFAAQPAVTLVPGPPLQASTGAWGWSLKLISRFSPEGLMTHEAFADLQSAGRRHVEVRLPAAASLIGVWIDDVAVARLEPGPQHKPFKLELPPGKSRSRLAVRYTTPTAVPALVGKVTPPFPTIDVPVVDRHWQLWLPTGHVVGDASGWLPAAQSVPLTWSERLFGALGRGAGQNLFNPLVASDWRESFAGRADTDLGRTRAQQLVTTIGNLLGEYRDAEELTWGQLLSSAADSPNAAGLSLIVDPQALAEAGIAPTTRMPPSDVKALNRGQPLLREAGLLLIATPDRVLLTSTAAAAGFDPRLVLRLNNDPIAVARGALAGQLRSVPGSEGQYLPLASWLADSEVALRGGEHSRFNLAAPAGWRRYDFLCPENSSCEARIVHASRMQSLAWAILLGTIGICLWRPILRGGVLIAALAVLGALALVVPASFTPLASAALLGTLIGVLARMTATSRPASSLPNVTVSSGSQSRFVRPVVNVLILAAISNAAAALSAAEPAAATPTPTESGPIFTVLFPTDDERQPAGSKVFVPEPFYAQLLRASAAASGRPHDWLITRAAYEGSVSRETATAGLAITTLKARFNVQVFQSNIPVQLPLARAAWEPAVSLMRLDGRPLAPDWQNDTGLSLGTLSVGGHVLEVELKPSAVSDERTSGIELPIPRVAQSTLKLSGTAELDSVRIPSARGRVTLDAERASLVAQLGATEQLAVRWPIVQGGTTPTATANLQVEELVWIRVRPGATLLDARLKFQVTSGELRSVRLSTDPRLRLLSSPSSGSPITAVRTFPGSPQTIELDLAQPVRDTATLDVSFLVTDASGVGNLRLPRLEASDAKASRRWLGVSVDPALQYRIQAGEDSPSVDITKFLEAWGIGDAKPLAAFAISRGEPIWFLATQPAEPRVAVQQKTILSVGRRSAQVRFEAALDITAGVLAQISMATPPNFKLDRISVLDQDVERVARWSTSDEGEISIFLTTPISGRQQLVLTGRWALPEKSSFEAPRWSLQSAAIGRCQWEFYRQNEILLTVNPPTEARPPEAPAEAARGEFGSLAAAFQADKADLSFGLQLADNNPQVSGALVTSARRDGDRYLANFDFRVEVTEGVLDSMQFEIPAQLVEPFRIEPVAAISVATAPATQRRVLTVTPASPVSGHQQFRIQGRIAPLPGERLRIPEVVPLATDSLERFVLLPDRLDAQPVSWETSRLTAAKLPAELVPRGFQPDAVSTYKVQDDGFQAVLKSVEREDARAVVQLADVHLTWLPSGGWRMAATYDLLPGGATDCELELPPGSELINATVEQLPASLVELGKGKYRLTLGPQNLPQRIEVLCAASQSLARPQNEFVVPRLAAAEPLQTLCTIYHLPEDRFEPLEQRLTVSASDQQLVRLNSTSRFVDLPADVLSEHLPEEISRWYGNWRRRYWTDRLALRRLLIAADRDPINSEEAGEARSLDQKMTALDDRLGSNNAAGRLQPVLDFVQSFGETAGAGLVSQHYLLKVTDGPLKIRQVHGSQGAQWRWLTATALAAFGCAVGWRLRSRELLQWPLFAIAALVATFWWLFLGPSMWGLLAGAVVLIVVIWQRNLATPS